VISPIAKARSPASINAASTASASPFAATATMPMPQLKVRSISASSRPPALASQPNTGGAVKLAISTRAATLSGSTRGMFSESPPPVMWASALMAPSAPPVASMTASTGFT
jgi:hypothetical protein